MAHTIKGIQNNMERDSKMIKLVKTNRNKAVYRIENEAIITVDIQPEALEILDFYNKIPANIN